MNKLPNEIINKIMLFHSHPVADLLKASNIVIFHNYRCGAEYFAPFYSGRRDAKRHREMEPNYCKNREVVEQDQMTEGEIEAYIIGYKNPNEDRK